MFRVRSPTVDRRDAGFTLIEVLIALAVASLSLVAIGAVVSSSARGARKVEQHVTLIEDARLALATAIPDRDRLQPKRLSDRAGSGEWLVQVTPVGGDWQEPAGKAGWLPEVVTLRVRTGSGAVADLRTVRLARTVQ